MKKVSIKCCEKLLTVFLSLLMVFTTFPLANVAHAETVAHNGVTITVKDDKDVPVAGANLSVTVESKTVPEKNKTVDVVTGTDGIADVVISDLIPSTGFIANDLSVSATVKYEIKDKDGLNVLETYNSELAASEVLTEKDNFNVVLSMPKFEAVNATYTSEEIALVSIKEGILDTDVVKYVVNDAVEPLTTIPTAIDAGDYKVNVTVERETKTIATLTLNSKINKAAIEDITIAPKTINYNGQDHELVTLNGNFLEGDKVTWTVNDTILDTCTYSADTPCNVPLNKGIASYRVKLSVDRGTNYEVLNTEEVTTTIAASSSIEGVEIKVKTDLAYNGDEQKLINKPTNKGYEFTYQVIKVEPQTKNEPQADAWTTNIPTGKDAGTYSVWVKATNNETNEVSIANYSVKIAKQELTLNFVEKIVEYYNFKDAPTLENLDVTAATGDETLDKNITITYSIEEVKGYSKEGFTLTKSKLNVTKPGVARVVASFEGDKNHEPATVEKIIAVGGYTRDKYNALEFEKPGKVDYTVNINNTINNKVLTNKVSNTNPITYTLRNKTTEVNAADYGLALTITQDENDSSKFIPTITVENYKTLIEKVSSNGNTLELTLNAKVEELRYNKHLIAKGGSSSLDIVIKLNELTKEEIKYPTPTADTNYWLNSDTPVNVNSLDGRKISKFDKDLELKFVDSVLFDDQGQHLRRVVLVDADGNIYGPCKLVYIEDGESKENNLKIDTVITSEFTHKITDQDGNETPTLNSDSCFRVEASVEDTSKYDKIVIDLYSGETKVKKDITFDADIDTNTVLWGQLKTDWKDYFITWDNLKYVVYDNAGNKTQEFSYVHNGKNDQSNPILNVEYLHTGGISEMYKTDENGVWYSQCKLQVRLRINDDGNDVNVNKPVVKVYSDGKLIPENPTITWTAVPNTTDSTKNDYQADIFVGSNTADGRYTFTVEYKDDSNNRLVYSVPTDATKLGSVDKKGIFTSNNIYIDNTTPKYTFVGFNEDKENPQLDFKVDDLLYFNNILRWTNSKITNIKNVEIAEALTKFANDFEKLDWTNKEDPNSKYVYQASMNIKDYPDGIYNLELHPFSTFVYSGDVEPINFVLDRSRPHDVSISYSSHLFDEVLNGITFGYYNPKVDIKFTAYDDVSGVQEFNWKFDKPEDFSENLHVSSESGTIVAEQDTTDKSKFTATITLTANEAKQYRGHISVSAIDKKGNASKPITDTGHVIVIDTIAPTMTIGYSDPVYTKEIKDTTSNTTIKQFYGKELTVNLDVTETNFHEEDVKVYVTKNGNLNDEIAQEVTWNGKQGKFTIKALEDHSNDGDYVVHVRYTDKSGNSYSYDSDKVFVIDTIKPVVKIAYANVAENGTKENLGYFNKSQVATITVTDKNFEPTDLLGDEPKFYSYIVDSVDITGNEVETAIDYSGEWTSIGNNQYQKQVTFNDAVYKFGFACSDVVGNKSDKYEPDTFTVDNTKPTNLSVTYSKPVFEEAYDEKSDVHYYNAEMEVTLVAEDITSGVDSFLYSYKNASNVSGVNSGKTDQIITKDNITYSKDKKTATATFKLPYQVLDAQSQFNGYVEFTATDRAGNTSDKFVAGDRLIVDNIAPTAQVTYNNPTNTVGDISYYDGDINATITITEANFHAEDVVVSVSKDGTVTRVTPTWKDDSLDVHTGTFTITGDADYIVTIDYKDRSQNEMVKYTSKQMTIDTKIDQPTYAVNGYPKVDFGGAYKNDVNVSFNFEDQNYDSHSIRLIRTRFNSVEDVTSEFIGVNANGKGGSGSFSIPAEVANDGIYELSISMNDKALHSTHSQLKFTVNRFGSVYEYNDELINLIKNGGQNVLKVENDLVITEYNADRILSNSLDILITRDGKPIKVDFTSNPNISSNVSIGDSGWYEYRYTIKASNFAEDGVYKISLTSKYAADDSAENESTSVPENSVDKTGNKVLDIMSFTVDSTKPEIRNVVNLEEAIINAQKVDVKYTIVDTGGLQSIEIIVNGKTVDKITDFKGDEFNYTGQFTINESSSAQSVQIKVTDLAGNITDTAASDFSTGDLYIFNDKVTVSTNAFVRWYANKPLFFGSIGLGIGAIAFIWFIIAKRKKDDDEETE